MIRIVKCEGTTGALRAGLLLLVLTGVAGTAGVLAYDRHWDGTWQMVPWATLAGIGFALAALLARSSRAVVWLARTLAVLTIVAAVLGVWRHFDENYNTASLDARYTDRWETMSTSERLWEVTNGSAGHVPIPASGVLIPIGLALGMATVGLGRSSQEAPSGGGRRSSSDTGPSRSVWERI